MQATKVIGVWGEIVASRVLEATGYQIIARNYRTFEGEVDIICRWNNIVIFVEVKTRRSFCFGGGEESVDQHKLLKLAKCGMRYRQEQAVDATVDWRIDVIVIETIGKHFYGYRHYQNVLWEVDEKLLDDS
ncbi:MAG: YraN family protein [Patescibacteria group bacterium]|jgi:putative endonuclease